MQKSKLDRFIQKYNLGGNVNSVKWKSTTDTLSTTFVTPDKSLLGTVKASKFQFEDAEIGVYHRGTVQGNVINLPEYWKGLVDHDTITVTLTPIQTYQELSYEVIDWGTKIKVLNSAGGPVNCSFVVYGERKDVDKLEIEYEGDEIR